jgi:hypothetical protein
VSALEAVAGATVVAPGGGNAQVLRGLGFRPRAVVAWWTCQSGHGVAAGNRGGLGFWTSSGAVSVGWSSEDGAPEVRASQVTADAALVGFSADGTTLGLTGSLASLDADGLTIAWTIAPTETWIVHFLALGGDGLTDARAGLSTVDGAATQSALDSLETDASLVLVAPARGGSDDVSRDGSIVGLGARSFSQQVACAYSVQSGATPGDVAGAQRHGVSIVLPELDRATCSGVLGGRFGAATIQWSDPPGRAHRVCHLTLEGIRVHVGVALSPTEPGKRRTRIGFRPDAILFFSWGLGAAQETKRIGRLCVGAASARDVLVCGGWDDRNAEDSRTGTHVVSSTDEVLVVTDTQSGGVHAAASVCEIGRRGFRLAWAASDGKTREVLFIALGAHTQASGNALRRVASVIDFRRRRRRAHV